MEGVFCAILAAYFPIIDHDPVSPFHLNAILISAV